MLEMQCPAVLAHRAHDGVRRAVGDVDFDLQGDADVGAGEAGEA